MPELSTPPHSASEGKRKLDIGDVAIVHTLYETYKVWHTLTIAFPKSQRYSLGQKCGDTLLEVLTRCVHAASVKDKTMKKQQLEHASVRLDLLRLLVRLSKDCECISNEQYLEVHSKLHEAGKMLGGWMKTL